MKKTLIAILIVGLVWLGLVLGLAGKSQHDPKDLRYWMRAGGGRDWSAEAVQGKPEAQLCLGLNLIRTNFQMMIDRVPGLSSIPIVGKRYFESISYGIDNNIAAQSLAEAHHWIKLAADQGYPPAREAEKLFIGRIPPPSPGTKARGAGTKDL